MATEVSPEQNAGAPGPDRKPNDGTPLPWKKRRVKNGLWAGTAASLIIVALLTLAGDIDTLARDLLRRFAEFRTTAPESEEVGADPAGMVGMLSFADLDLHPDIRFAPYTGGPLLTNTAAPLAGMIDRFRQFLELYVQRQGIDDNFTLRVVDERDGRLLELFELELERDNYRQSDKKNWDWGRIDRMRRRETRRLVDKWSDEGIPRKHIVVKWGRADQVREARENEKGYVAYEVALARYLGLSLLATEIGTVETFNNDRAVSPVGARGRYQMMPYTLRQNKIHHYQLLSATGRPISVVEEWHPLLTMEPAFLVVKGFSNAVGHEFPGISAYHTGPGNIFDLYRVFLSSESRLLPVVQSVMDAYVWGVTDGFPTASARSSFGTFSRGYVATGYGSLRAMQDEPIDLFATQFAERVQLLPGSEIYLSRLLRALRDASGQVDWSVASEIENVYERFRRLNPHLALPAAPDSNAMPVEGDVRLVSEVQGVPVRFFLPLGAADYLGDLGIDVIDPATVLRFDHNTYRLPQPEEITLWDREYDRLVGEISRFGFSKENRTRLAELKERFEVLARENPSPYRDRQLQIIRNHWLAWTSPQWSRLASTLAAVEGSLRAPIQPPASLPGIEPVGP